MKSPKIQVIKDSNLVDCVKWHLKGGGINVNTKWAQVFFLSLPAEA
jgi:hypothetical protein